MVSEVEMDKSAMGVKTLIENSWDTEMRERLSSPSKNRSLVFMIFGTKITSSYCKDSAIPLVLILKDY